MQPTSARARGAAQRARLALAAEAYARRFPGRDLRFDVVTVEEGPERLVIEHLRDAFGEGGALR